MSPTNFRGIWRYLSQNIFVLISKFNILVLQGVVLIFVLSGWMYYSLIINFPSLHVHVFDLKPFQVSLSDIRLTRHHCVKLVWPFVMFILFQTLKHYKSKRRKTPQIQAHQRHASIKSFIQLVAINHIIINVDSSKTITSLYTG
jgi:hypothetical protein